MPPLPSATAPEATECWARTSCSCPFAHSEKHTGSTGSTIRRFPGDFNDSNRAPFGIKVPSLMTSTSSSPNIALPEGVNCVRVGPRTAHQVTIVHQ